ncbi:hypothetical protein [Oceanobacillus sp. 1P07AA]|uniref:hypothetical protein n=1 Tax=Oceanobacillus sp. 1P07AA TaxID=3132293 RepID=UPI0039A55BD0
MKETRSRKGNLTLISVVGGGIAGWIVNFGLSILSNSDITHLYGISIFLGVIVGLLWDISDKLNRE